MVTYITGENDVIKSLSISNNYKLIYTEVVSKHEIFVDPKSLTVSVGTRFLLCFQVFLEGNEKGAFTFALKPVVSDPIYDKSELFSFHPMKSVLMMRKLNRGKDGIVDMPHDRIQRVCRRWKGHAALLRQGGQGWHTGRDRIYS